MNKWMNLNAMQRLFFLMLLVYSSSACKKIDDWLDVKSSRKDVIPVTLTDYQAILDYTTTINTRYPVFGLVGTDNYYVPDANFGSLTQDERNFYKFDLTGYQSLTQGSHSGAYILIGSLNVVLDGLEKGGLANSVVSDNIKGQALFHRSNMFYLLAQLFCKPYDGSTAATDKGLQLKLNSDPNIIVPRSTNQQSYDQMLNDLKTAADLLPVTPVYSTRPSRPAAYALLSKTYLSMGDYTNAALYVKKAMDEFSALLDYNSSTVISSSTFRFPVYSNTAGNPEIIFYAEGQTYTSLWPSYNVSYVDSFLYRSYHKDDLRKKLLYIEDAQQRGKFTGSYTGTYTQFAGIATNELYLISAECKARKSDITGAMEDLNLLLSKRWDKSAAYTPLTAGNAEEALSIILTERRKELPFTGQLRWEDLRRLNKDPRFAKTVVHKNNGAEFRLVPGDKRYTLLIPEQEINISGIEQNER